MKLNERLYDVLGFKPYKEPNPGEDYVPIPSEPIETQVCGKHQVEIYYMNEYTDVLHEFTRQNKFAVWSSKDGVNYRLAVEKEYYEKVSDLYTVAVNERWLKFWDDCEVIQNNFSKKIVLPTTIIVVVLFLFFANWNNMFKNAQMNSTLSLALTIGIPLVYMIVMLFLRKNVMTKIQMSQENALKSVREYFGDKKFEELLKIQRTYIDDYFDKHDEDDDESLLNDTESNNQENNEETKEEDETKVEETPQTDDTQEEKENTDK